MNMKIKSKTLLSILVLLACCDIAYISYLCSYFSALLLFVRIFLILFLGLKLLFKKNKIKTSKVFIFFNCLILLFSANSIFRTTSIIYYIINIFSKPYLIMLYIQNNFDNNKKIVDILEIWKKVLLLLCIIDSITIIIFPNGMYFNGSYPNNWFLGYKTARMVYSWALLFITSYLEFNINIDKECHLSKSTLISFITCIFSAFCSSATGACSAIILYVFLVLSLYLKKNKGKRLYRLFNHKRILLYFILIYSFVMSVESNVYVQNIVTTIFNKSATLSNRTDIWKNCIDFFITSPIFGKGIFTPTEYINITNFFQGTNAHNYLLTLLISGGIVCLCIYFGIFRVSMCRNNKRYSKKELVLIYAIISFLFVGLTSSAMAYSTFAFLPFILLEQEKVLNREDDFNEKIINKK